MPRHLTEFEHPYLLSLIAQDLGEDTRHPAPQLPAGHAARGCAAFCTLAFCANSVSTHSLVLKGRPIAVTRQCRQHCNTELVCTGCHPSNAYWLQRFLICLTACRGDVPGHGGRQVRANNLLSPRLDSADRSMLINLRLLIAAEQPGHAKVMCQRMEDAGYEVDKLLARQLDWQIRSSQQQGADSCEAVAA